MSDGNETSPRDQCDWNSTGLTIAQTSKSYREGSGPEHGWWRPAEWARNAAAFEASHGAETVGR